MRKNLVALLWGAGGTAIVLVLYVLWGVMYEDHARTTFMWNNLIVPKIQPQQQQPAQPQPAATPGKK